MPGHDKITPYQPYDFNAANKHYADNHPFPDMVVGARSQTGIITCCDARSSPEHFFELKENEAFVMRNGGGRASDPGVIRTITLVSILAEIKELKIVHHTDCGGLAFDDGWVREMIEKNDPNAPGGPFKEGALQWAESMAFLPFPSRKEDSNRDRVERSIREDVKFLQDHPLVKASIKITGWIYDLHDGTVTEVK